VSVALILPARLASTRLPEKLLRVVAGKTLLEHTLARAREAQARSNGLISRILVAADDERLMAVARRAGADAVMTDPNHASGTDRIAEAAAPLREETIVNLQADEPELQPANVLKAIGAFRSDGCAPSASMGTLAVPITDEREFLKSSVVKVVVGSNGRALYFSRAPIPFDRDGSGSKLWTDAQGRRIYGLHHIGLYVYRRAFLLGYKTLPASRLEQLEKLEQLRALESGHPITVGIVESNPPGIDTPEDLAAFEARVAAAV
jgi:3-deoxy-manno-octulosonate cytidylyltransferase (CMP-KDO synthetase)